MFQQFTNYLLGISQQDATGASSSSSTTNDVVPDISRLTSIETDDEWILIEDDDDLKTNNYQKKNTENDNNSDGNSICSSTEEDNDDIINLEAIKCRRGGGNQQQQHRRRRQLMMNDSISESFTQIHHMEESWFLTPPPCFISTGPVHMETSPLENLLIEHPSMSVYRRNIDPPSTMYPVFYDEDVVVDHNKDVDEQLQQVEEDLVVVWHQRLTGTPRQPRINRLQAVQQREQQIIKHKQAQKVQKKKACEALKKGPMDRTNKAREVNCRNRRQRRGERSQGANRSHANNNRKC